MKKLFFIFFIITFFSSIFFSQEIPIYKNDDFNNVETSTESPYKPNLIFERTYSSSEIKNIDINLSYEEIEFSESHSKDFSLELFSNNNKLLPKITHTNNTIKIITTNKETTIGDICKIILYIPKDCRLQNLIIKDINKTNKIINLNNIKADTISINTNKSNISGQYIYGDLTINTNEGNIDFYKILSEKCSIFTKNGQISIKNANFNQLYAISQSKNIKIENFTGEYLYIKNTTGTISADNITADYFDIQNDLGDSSISILEVPTGSSFIKSKSGFIQLFVPVKQDFNLIVHSNNGTFYNKLEKKRFTPRHQYEKHYNKGGASITVNTVSGDIEVDRY